MRAGSTRLADVLFGKARGAILALLYGRTDQQFYYRELTRRLDDLSPGTLQRELDTLSNLGLIERLATGKRVFYRANRNHSIFTELQTLVAKTVGVIHVLSTRLAPLADRIAVAFIYGSMARKEERAESDIDLLIIGRVSLEAVLVELAEAEAFLERPINPTVYSPSEFKKRLASGNHFLNSVVRGDKVFLIGDEDELRKVGRVRLAQNRTHESQ